ncbi:integrase [Nitrosospira multiformis]|uniref:Integrase n=2 Tax=Nitrosospira multiformis TaxID=1231 RepID=A0A2T5IE20_9PROT|nr:integrase [Nitrosospira multiformis]
MGVCSKECGSDTPKRLERVVKMALTDLQVKKAKASDKPQKLSDGGGLYLLVQPNGAKYWRLKYRFAGVEKLLALGVYPDVSLLDARERREKARKLLANEADPGAVKKAQKEASVAVIENSFEIVAREWFMKHAPNWADTHSCKVIRRLEVDAFPWIGARPIGEITAPELLAMLRRVESRGALDTAHRVHQNCGQVFRYAIATGRAQRDPSTDLRGALPPPNRQHYPTITDPKAIGELLRAIDGYSGTYSTRYALRLAPMLFVRPSELRKAEWCEFNLDKAEWRIPAKRMKMNALHIVPLSTQAVAILRELYCISGAGKYVFPSARTTTKPMSDNTINAALHRLGYKGEFVGHGFRHMASTLLNEQGWNRDAIERQLAHAERDGVRAAYNYAEYLPERKRMMQHWADYLDKLEAGADVIPLHKTA